MKGKKVIWIGLGLFSVCSMLYRAPQIVSAMGGATGEAGGVPDAGAIPGGALSGLLQAMGKQPMSIEALRAGGEAEQEAPQAPSADNLRLFGTGGDVSEEKARELLKRAAAASPANAITARGTVAKNEAATKKPRAGAPKVVVHKAAD